MTIPGFTAAVSLDRTDKRYQMHWTVGPADDAIYPAQGPDCFGTVAQCRDDHCAGLEGKEHGLCWNACAQPTMCEPSCSWHPESGSFSRFCYKRLPGPQGRPSGATRIVRGVAHVFPIRITQVLGSRCVTYRDSQLISDFVSRLLWVSPWHLLYRTDG